MARPTKLPRWATGGSAVIAEPSEPEKDAGHLPQTILTAQLANWLSNLVYQWIVYLDGDRPPLTTTTAPAQVTATTVATIGTDAGAAHADHVHALPTAAPAALAIGSTVVTGVSASLARADHVHAMPAAAAPAPLTIGGTVVTGVSASLARADHVHAMPTAAAPVQLTATLANGAGSSSSLARADHAHDVFTSAPSALAIGSTQVTGTSAGLARADHVHAMPAAAAPSAIVVGGSSVSGVAATLSRSDHVPPIAAFGAASGTFCEGSDVRLDAGVIPFQIENNPGSLLYADEFLAGSNPDLATRGYTCVNVATGATMTRLGPVNFGTISLTATQYNSSIIGSWLYIQTGAVMSVTKTMAAPFGCIALRGLPSSGVAGSAQRCGLLIADTAVYSTSKKFMVGFVDGVSSVLTLGASSQTGTGAITVGTGAAPTTGNYDADVHVASKGVVTAEWGVSIRKAAVPAVITEFWSLSPAVADTATVFGFVVHSGNTGAGQRHVAIDYLRRYPANTFFGY